MFCIHSFIENMGGYGQRVVKVLTFNPIRLIAVGSTPVNNANEMGCFFLLLGHFISWTMASACIMDGV